MNTPATASKRTVKCAHPSCTTQVSPRKFACPGHWYSIPETLRNRIWVAARAVWAGITQEKIEHLNAVHDEARALWAGKAAGLGTTISESSNEIPTPLISGTEIARRLHFSAANLANLDQDSGKRPIHTDEIRVLGMFVREILTHGSETLTEIRWHSCTEIPQDQEPVIAASADEEVEVAYFDEDLREWRGYAARRIDKQPTHWTRPTDIPRPRPAYHVAD